MAEGSYQTDPKTGRRVWTRTTGKDVYKGEAVAAEERKEKGQTALKAHAAKMKAEAAKGEDEKKAPSAADRAAKARSKSKGLSAIEMMRQAKR